MMAEDSQSLKDTWCQLISRDPVVICSVLSFLDDITILRCMSQLNSTWHELSWRQGMMLYSWSQHTAQLGQHRLAIEELLLHTAQHAVDQQPVQDHSLQSAGANTQVQPAHQEHDKFATTACISRSSMALMMLVQRLMYEERWKRALSTIDFAIELLARHRHVHLVRLLAHRRIGLMACSSNGISDESRRLLEAVADSDTAALSEILSQVEQQAVLPTAAAAAAGGDRAPPPSPSSFAASVRSHYALQLACAIGRADVVHAVLRILSHHPAVHAFARAATTCLQFSCRQGNLPVVRALLQECRSRFDDSHCIVYPIRVPRHNSALPSQGCPLSDALHLMASWSDSSALILGLYEAISHGHAEIAAEMLSMPEVQQQLSADLSWRQQRALREFAATVRHSHRSVSSSSSEPQQKSRTLAEHLTHFFWVRTGLV